MIKYLVMDVDGTLTDGKIYMSSNGELMKAFSIKDGCGIHDILIPAGITPVIITGRKSEIVERRSAELGIQEVYQGVLDKNEKLIDICKSTNTSLAEVAYIGDDLNDLSCMRMIKGNGGIVGCPFDSAIDVKCIADFISQYDGGKGAVREFIEWLVSSGSTSNT